MVMFTARYSDLKNTALVDKLLLMSIARGLLAPAGISQEFMTSKLKTRQNIEAIDVLRVLKEAAVLGCVVRGHDINDYLEECHVRGWLHQTDDGFVPISEASIAGQFPRFSIRLDLKFS